ncbi:MAG: hypothetical protein AB7O59_23925 [Pirellulales bacterium]
MARRSCLMPLVWCAAALLCTAQVARGDDAAPPRLDASPAIAARLHWIQYHMISGRLAASSNLTVPKMLVQSPGRRTGRRETLAIEINAGICNMEYNSAAQDDQLRIEVTASNQISIRRHRPNDHYTLHFVQRPDQPLVLNIEQGDTKRRWQADGFWQLYLDEPTVVREHLIPLVELLRPSWQLAATGAEIEEALLRAQKAPQGDQPDRQRWSQWVAALASAKFAEREGAQRALHDAGQAVVPYLQSLDRTKLDPEQVARIRAVLDGLRVEYEDRVDRVAAWLARDPRAWLALARRDDPAQRRVAAEQLSGLLGAPVDFDPDAAPEMRGQQLDRLRVRLQTAREVAEPAE